MTQANKPTPKPTAPKPSARARARYNAKRDEIEVEWQDSDAPGNTPHEGRSCYRCIGAPQILNPLMNRCYTADRIGGMGEWVDLTDEEMIKLGFKRL